MLATCPVTAPHAPLHSQRSQLHHSMLTITSKVHSASFSTDQNKLVCMWQWCCFINASGFFHVLCSMHVQVHNDQ